jgi:hypothetical protein
MKQYCHKFLINIIRMEFFSSLVMLYRHARFTLPFLVILACGDTGKFDIAGEIENGKGKVIYLDKLEITGPSVMDSAKIGATEKFSFSGSTSDPAFYRLRLETNNFITLLAEPGEKITVKADASNLPGTYQVAGSESSALLKKLNDRLNSTQSQMAPLVREFIALDDSPASREEETRINKELDDIINAQRSFSIAFILENIESLAAITALYQQLDDENYVLGRTRDIQFLKIVAESLNKIYPQSPHVRALVNDAANQERGYELYKFSVIAEQTGNVVTTYPDIAMPGIDGDTIRLQSLPQKYILVLFGSSRNQASVALTHDLIPLYKAYHSKGFQIYHVSIERDRQEWLNSIKFSELPWIHVAQFGESNFRAAQVYNVQQLPANYLINQEAGIVARDISVRDLGRRLNRVLD